MVSVPDEDFHRAGNQEAFHLDPDYSSACHQNCPGFLMISNCR